MATSPEAELTELLCDHLKTLTFSPPIAVAWPSVPFVPVIGVTHLEVFDFRNRTQSPFLENDAESVHTGIFQVSVVSPLDIGIIKPREIAGRIVDHFACGTVLRAAGNAFAVKVYDKPFAASPIIDDKNVSVPVTIRWRAFI